MFEWMKRWYQYLYTKFNTYYHPFVESIRSIKDHDFLLGDEQMELSYEEMELRRRAIEAMWDA